MQVDTSIQSHIQIARAALQKRHYWVAVPALKSVVAAEPNHVEAYELLGIAETFANNPAGARQASRPATDHCGHRSALTGNSGPLAVFTHVFRADARCFARRWRESRGLRHHLQQARRNGGTWTHENAQGAFVGFDSRPCIAIDSQGNPHLAYRNLSTAELVHTFKHGAQWSSTVMRTRLDPQMEAKGR